MIKNKVIYLQSRNPWEFSWVNVRKIKNIKIGKKVLDFERKILYDPGYCKEFRLAVPKVTDLNDTLIINNQWKIL